MQIFFGGSHAAAAAGAVIFQHVDVRSVGPALRRRRATSVYGALAGVVALVASCHRKLPNDLPISGITDIRSAPGSVGRGEQAASPVCGGTASDRRVEGTLRACDGP